MISLPESLHPHSGAGPHHCRQNLTAALLLSVPTLQSLLALTAGALQHWQGLRTGLTGPLQYQQGYIN